MFIKGDYYFCENFDIWAIREDGVHERVAHMLDANVDNAQLFCAAPMLYECARELFDLLRFSEPEGEDYMVAKFSLREWGKLLQLSTEARLIATGWRDKRKRGTETD